MQSCWEESQRADCERSGRVRGLSGIISDQTMVQFKMLNKSKGPAMWSPRCQSDRMRFAEMRMELEKLKTLTFARYGG